MKAALLLATIASVAITAQAANEINPLMQQTDNSTVAFAQSVKFVSGMARGFIAGYKKGMYKDSNYRVRNDCFGKETQDLVVGVFDDWGKNTFDWGNEIVSFQKALILTADNCEYDESVYDLLSFCYQGEQCEFPNMVQTLLKKVFQVTTVANDFAQIMMEGLPKETDSQNTVEDFAERVGSNCGKLLRYATDFDPTLIQSVF